MQVRLQQLQRQKPAGQAAFTTHAYNPAGSSAAASDVKASSTTSAAAHSAQAGVHTSHAHSHHSAPENRPAATVPLATTSSAPTLVQPLRQASQSAPAQQQQRSSGACDSRVQHADAAKQSSVAAVGIKPPQLKPADNSAQLYSVRLLPTRDVTCLLQMRPGCCLNGCHVAGSRSLLLACNLKKCWVLKLPYDSTLYTHLAISMKCRESLTASGDCLSVCADDESR